MSSKKIGLYFGSFNPIHNGHLSIAVASLEDDKIGLDQVWFVVSPHNPNKERSILCDEWHRLRMVQIAISCVGKYSDKLSANNVEFGMPKPSYTIDTIKKLELENTDCVFFIIMGADTFMELPEWKEGRTIRGSYNIIVHQRPGKEIDCDRFSNFDNIYFSEKQFQIELSSTQIRERIKNDKPIGHMVPFPVAEYIENNRIFMFDENSANREV